MTTRDLSDQGAGSSSIIRPGMVLDDRYYIEKELARGGIGIVFLANDKKIISRKVVVKVLLEEMEESGDGSWFKRKFRQEIEALGRIEHPGVVKVFDVGEMADGKSYLVMEFIDGVNLRAKLDLLRNQRIEGMDLERVAHIMRQLGQAISAAHREKVFHRDLKPENIMLHSPGEDEELVKVIDFGIATVKDSQVATNRSSTAVAGTLAYMAPEQLMARPEAASDIYALGIIAYEMVTGRVPFNTKTAVQQYELQQEGIKAMPKDLRPGLPDAAQDVILKALSFNPRDRQSQARRLGEDLARALTTEADENFVTGQEYSSEGAGVSIKSSPPPSEPTSETAPIGSRGAESSPSLTQTVEIAYVLFMNLVGHSKLLMDEQVQAVERLQEIVSATSEFSRARENKEVVTLDTEDGMALVFFHNPEAPVRCALEIADVLSGHDDIRLRIGVHSGPVYRRKGIDNDRNVAGSGIKIAQQVMAFGDAGHILLSKTIADFLGQLSRWAGYLHDLGECHINQTRLHLFNLYTGELGNKEAPKKCRPVDVPLDEQTYGSQTYGSQPDDPQPSEKWQPAVETPPSQSESDPRESSFADAEEEQPPSDNSQPDDHSAPPASEPRAADILTQLIGVSHRQDPRGNEALIYAPVPLGIEEEAPEPEFVPIKWQILQRHIDEVRARVEDLTRRALVGKGRENSGIEAAASELARHVLPEQGFVGMMGKGFHPRFDIIQDAASEIPWEVLEECYFHCPNCNTFLPPHRPLESVQPHCRNCGHKMVWTGNKLSLTYHLTHMVRGQGWAGGEDKEFLLIQDPEDNLCDPSKDPEGVCARHLIELRRIIEGHGYDINLLEKKNATVKHVLSALSNPSVVGIYYFGHGFFPRNGDEGCLVLADGLLFASQIEDIKPKARFVFLNACEGAATGRDWGLDKRAKSVATAFARGGKGRVVIAPLWPVINVQAAEAALDFFNHASPYSSSAEALRYARENSLQRYEDGEPHITWMAYRYYGDPNRTLPVPRKAPVESGASAASAIASRIFDGNGRFDTEVFAFAVDEVLLRAAKRRNLQDRPIVTTADFIAGMIRKGDLTRFILRQMEIDPDSVYLKLGEHNESGSAEDDESDRARSKAKWEIPADLKDLDEKELREILSKWVVRDREQFSYQLIQILTNGDELARRARSQDQRISEQSMLQSLIADQAWEDLTAIGLPPADSVRRLLQQREASDLVDENGAISLAGLDEGARKIVETVHDLAQQRGIYPITNRLMLAAFLADNNGYAARVCARANVRPKLLYVLMIAAHKKRAPFSFGLSPEACEHIVIPVIEEARNKASGKGDVSEKNLFIAFCEKAHPGIKEFLKLPALAADLDKLKLIDPPADDDRLKRLDGDARSIIETACALARKLKALPVPNRLMLAAFLINEDGHAARLFARHGVPADLLCSKLIESVGGDFGDLLAEVKDQPAQSFVFDPEECEGVALETLLRAEELAADKGMVDERTLFKAFCEVIAPSLKKSLKRSPLKIDLDALGNEPSRPPRPASEKENPPDLKSDDLRSSALLSGRHSVDIEDEQSIRRDEFEESAWRVIIEASRLARLQGWIEIRSPHLFAAMIGDGSGPAGVLLQRLQASPEELKAQALSLVPPKELSPDAAHEFGIGRHVFQIMRRASKLAARGGRARINEEDILTAFFADGGGVIGELLNAMMPKNPAEAPRAQSHAMDARQSILSALGNDLTEKAKRDQLPAIVGREKEIEAALQTLLLIENANPLLVGEAGVGKTAIVEGIAQRIASGDCPEKLRACRLVEVPAGGLIANTSLRGEFEQRIRQLLDEARSDVILFIDEIHTIVGAGSAEGGGPDAGNLLKAALARGEIRLIGATTHAEYKRTIARDKALARRFQIQMINPPSREATIKALSAHQALLEQHHGVRITKKAKEAAVDLSGRYIIDKHWPAKARDVLERACVIAASKRKGNKQSRASVTPKHVAEIVSRQTGIPVKRVSAGGMTSLATLEEKLSKHIIGQRLAVSAIADCIRRGRQGLSGEGKPWGVFLLVGPPGIGKTEMAKVVAEEVYGGSEGLIRFDMGDFTEPHSVAKLTGAPPGYVGYSQGAPLVERLRKHPYSLILFDEIEHAHENVLAVLLRLFSEGTLTDPDGNLADARNTIIIMTTNLLGAEPDERRLGFAPEHKDESKLPSQADLRTAMGNHLPGKFIDRLDAIVRFAPLERDALVEIAEKTIAEATARAAALYRVSVEAGPEVAAWIVEKAASESSGARAIQRCVETLINAPLGAALNSSQASRSDRVIVSVDEGAILVKLASAGR